MKTKKFKWIKVRKDRFSLEVAQVDVSHLNEIGIEREWDRLDAKYPGHLSSLCEEKRAMPPAFFEN